MPKCKVTFVYSLIIIWDIKGHDGWFYQYGYLQLWTLFSPLEKKNKTSSLFFGESHQFTVNWDL